MLNRQYCASAYTIDYENKKVLLMYNKKLNKWLQPGGHIEGNELPSETAIRETLEETGIKIEIVGPTYDNKVYQPIAVENYKNKVGDMIDIQFLAIPVTKYLENSEKNETKWFEFKEMLKSNEIDDEIKNKVINLYETFLKNRNNFQ